jgi:hypothetical protein
MKNKNTPSEGTSSDKQTAESALRDAACCASSFIGGSQEDSSGQAEHRKSPGPSSSELVSSLEIDENPKQLRLQCSCGQIIELMHTQSPEGIHLSLSQPSSQTSETSPLLARRANAEELRNALFGDGSSSSEFLHNADVMASLPPPRSENSTKH